MNEVEFLGLEAYYGMCNHWVWSGHETIFSHTECMIYSPRYHTSIHVSQSQTVLFSLEALSLRLQDTRARAVLNVLEMYT